ncbi:MAG: hypothetical protein FWE54_02435 [Methanimicrococcus sp.]|nr:hypothetical protein [Methanimicrococcus sp.]
MTFRHGLKMLAADRKIHLADIADTEQLLLFPLPLLQLPQNFINMPFHANFVPNLLFTDPEMNR